MAYLDADFFARDTLQVARDLIGVTLVVGDLEGRIVETEAYTTDAASHAVTRRKQAEIMSATFGFIYIYLIYGMYHCLNFTTERAGTGAVLVRAVEPVKGIERMMARRGTSDPLRLACGPGRLCEAFAIDLTFNARPVGSEIKLRDRTMVPEIAAAPRIGISRATELEWRFYEAGNQYVSRTQGQR
jgi:DNA-3-methyladenine glycosylase